MLSPQEQEAARELEEQDRLRFRKEGHKAGRWDEAHFGVRAIGPKKPEPRPSHAWPMVKWAAALGVLACASLFAADWFGAINLGIRSTIRPDASITSRGDAQERAMEQIERDLGDSPYAGPAPSAGTPVAAPTVAAPVADPADVLVRETPAQAANEAAPLLVSAKASPTKPAPGPTAAQLAERQRGLAHLLKQRPAAVADVDKFLAAIKRAEIKGPDGLTYEERLYQAMKAEQAKKEITANRAKLELEWDLFLARKNENATRLAHAREVLEALDKRISAVRGQP